MEEKRISLDSGKFRQCAGNFGLCGHPFHQADAGIEIFVQWITGIAGIGAKLPDLTPLFMPQQVRRDAVEPRSYLSFAGIERVPAPKCHGEGFSSQILGDRGVDSAPQVTQDLGEVAIEKGREKLRAL